MDDLQHFSNDFRRRCERPLLPVDFMDGLLQDRLGAEPEHVDTGHLPALANPKGLVEVLLR